MRYLVTWTSGLDSTAMISRLLEEGHEVIAVYFRLTTNYNKTNRELAAIDKLLPFFQDNTNFKYLGIVAEIDHGGTGAPARFPIYCLTLPFMIGLADRHGADVIAYGFTAHDIIISYWDEVRALHAAYQPFAHRQTRIEAPMMKVPKDQSWHGLPEEMRQHIVYCEDPSVTEGDCGKCAQCRRMVFHQIKRYE